VFKLNKTLNNFFIKKDGETQINGFNFPIFQVGIVSSNIIIGYIEIPFTFHVRFDYCFCPFPNMFIDETLSLLISQHIKLLNEKYFRTIFNEQINQVGVLYD
jgi:hypothetical protein